MKKILIITGSPRKGGNTAVVSKWVAEGAEEAGASVELADAARLQYKTYGCTSCYGCQKSPEYRCIVHDEASDLIARIPEFDVVVIASPVYFMGFSAQIKLVLDRFFSLCKITDAGIKHPLQKTSIALIATAGGDEGSGLNLLKKNMEMAAGFFGKPIKKFSVPFAPAEPGEIETNSDIKEKAMSFGAELAS